MIYPDSRVVDRATLDPTKVYLQITHLEPYFTQEFLMTHPTFFKRNTNISMGFIFLFFFGNFFLGEFFFVTPFTPSGKAHGPINEQYKRKTILTVQPGFPSLLKRLPVVAKREEVSTPIENAIEDIVVRTLSIQEELQREKANTKALQSLLQGSVRLRM